MKPEIVLVGTGPGPVSLLTSEAQDELLNAARVFFRMSHHPVYHWLRQRRVNVLSFDLVYATPRIAYHEIYEFIAAAILKEAERSGRAVYALPGNPFVLEHTSSLIERMAHTCRIELRIVPGMSFLEIVYAELRLDPIGIQICNAVEFPLEDCGLSEHRALLIAGLFARADPGRASRRTNAANVSRWLRSKFPAIHPISLVWTPGMPDYSTYSKQFPLKDFDRECERLCDAPCASVYVPPLLSPEGQ